MSLLVDNINFKDISGNSIITESGGVVSITAPNSIILTSDAGSIEFPETVNMNNLNITNVNLIDSNNNTDLTISVPSTATSFQLRTSNTARVNMNTTRAISTGVMRCSAGLPTLNTEFISLNTFTNIQTYTPSLQASSGTLTIAYTDRGGRWLQFGNLVWFSMFVILSSFTATSSGATVRVTLPVTKNNNIIHSFTTGFYSGLDGTTDVATISAQVAGAPRSFFVLNKKATGTSTSFTNLLYQDIGQTFSIVITGFYYIS